MSLFVPPTPGAKFQFTPKQSAKVRTVKEDDSPLRGYRSWDRVPVTPVAPRRKSHKVWKRFLEETRDATAKDGLQNMDMEILESAYVFIHRGIKRLKISHGDHGSYAGRSFLETKWETDDMRIKERKIPSATVKRSASSPTKVETQYACTNEATSRFTNHTSPSGPAEHIAHEAQSFGNHIDNDNNWNNNGYDDEEDGDEENPHSALNGHLAPISSPAPVYISPETSLILAEEDEEETTMLESAPTTRTLLSSPPAVTDYTLDDNPKRGEERDVDKQSALLHHPPSQSQREEEPGLQLRITPPLIQNSLLLDDDAEFLTEFLMKARAKREAKLRDHPVREAACLTEPADPSEAPDVSPCSEPSNPDCVLTSADWQDTGAESKKKDAQPSTHCHGNCGIPDRMNPSNSVNKRKTDGEQRMKSRRKGNFGLKKQTRCSPKSRQSKVNNLPAAFDSNAITERVRKRNSTRKVGPTAENGAGKQNQRRMPELQVQVHAEDAVVARQIYLCTQKNTKANKGDAKRAPTVLRRMRLEERKKKKDGDKDSETGGNELVHKPKRTSSKRVRWDEERLMVYIDDESSGYDEPVQESNSGVVADRAKKSAAQDDGDSSVDRDSSPDPIVEAEVAILQKPACENTFSTFISQTDGKQDHNVAPKRSSTSPARSHTVRPGKSKGNNNQQSRLTELPSLYESIDTLSLSPILLGIKRQY
ncbi:hypothetical protein KEM54_005685 [Ascosphaera aggregata]|nr:hypothetical protein KEM54_005685 [Ascosphaera aggregata]